MQPDTSGVEPLDMNLATRASVGDTLTRTAAMFGDRTAIIHGERQVTYQELDRISTQLANALLDTGLQRQQPVAMAMANSIEFVIAYYACAKAGLVALPLNIALTGDDIEWILRDAGATTIIADSAALELLEPFFAAASTAPSVIVNGAVTEHAPSDAIGWEHFLATGSNSPVRVPVYDRDTLQCLYTSGTTSRPKGVLISHLSALIAGMTNAMQIGHRWGSESSTLINVLPLFHTTALNTLVLPVLFTGGTVVLHAAFDPREVLADIDRHQATHVMLLPVMYQALVNVHDGSSERFMSLRCAVYAMAPMPSGLLDAVDEMFPNASVILGSGQTEVVPATVLQWPQHQETKANSWGPAVPTVETAILGAAGQQLASGQSGEIAYRGPHVCSGYWNNPEANRHAFAGGWFHSGDIGYLDDEHVVWFTDRLKDIIKTGGENVSSVDVERIVATVPGVAECAIIGMPDDRWGEAVTAVVVPAEAGNAEGLDEKITAFAKQHLAGFQVPKRIVIAHQLPKTATGKIQKHLVRQYADDA